MKNTSLPGLKWKQAACLGASFLLLGPATRLLARGAPPVALPVYVADVDLSVVLEAPPPPRAEVVIERDRPSHEHVWIRGYWINRHGHHEWVAGHWEVPPRGRTVWIEPRWEKRGRGYVFVEGYWTSGRPDDHDHHDRR